MYVNKTPGDIAGTQPLKPSSAATVQTTSSDAADQVQRGDAVQISDAGLALSGNSGTSTSSDAAISPHKADSIRTKILSGAYNSLDAADKVARSIIASGDLK